MYSTAITSPEPILMERPFATDLSSRSVDNEKNIINNNSIYFSKDNESIEKIESVYERYFNILADRWTSETCFFSSSSDIYSNIYYVSIMRNADKRYVSYILRRLRYEPYHWFALLKRLTAANPVPSEHLGAINKMVEDWCNWGIQNGYLDQ